VNARAAADTPFRDRLIVGLDLETVAAADAMVERLGDAVRVYKIGKQLFVHGGPDVVGRIRARGADVFLDLKFHDIPNTVAGAGAAAARLGVRFFTVHASGGLAMMKRVVAEVKRVCRRERLSRPQILAVTVLTSLGGAELRQLGIAGGVETQVARLAQLARRAGCDGVVASPREITRIRRACGRDFLIVTPGVRPTWADRNDQQRVTTPGDAIAAGADFLVVGRPVLAADDPAGVANEIVAEMARAGDRRG